MRALQIIVVIITLCITSCSWFAAKPDHIETGDRVVTILYKQSEFKDRIVETVSTTLTDRGYTVIIDNTKRAKYYPAAQFGAVVYMAEYWARHTPWHAKRYFRKNDESGNIVFVITSSDPDITITKPFDAICSASKPERAEPVVQDIVSRLDKILK